MMSYFLEYYNCTTYCKTDVSNRESNTSYIPREFNNFKVHIAEPMIHI